MALGTGAVTGPAVGTFDVAMDGNKALSQVKCTGVSILYNGIE